MSKNLLLISFIVAAFGLAYPTAKSDIRLPGFFGDHMVLQQEKPIRIWGWGDPGENVTVELGSDKATTTVDTEGNWNVELPQRKASPNPLKLSVSGKNKIELNDLLMGEVWLCSGQSNMEWSVAASGNPAEEIAAAKYPLIRHIKIPRKPSMTPINNMVADWEICSPETAGRFTACGYYMARKLHQELNVPIGLINSSWGGTRVEPWTPPTGFKAVKPVYSIYHEIMGKTAGSDRYKQRLSEYVRENEAWLLKAKSALEQNTDAGTPPAYPDSLQPYTSHQSPTMLYNGMIHAMVGLPLRGAIWYQGESNHDEGMLYFEKKKALINGWRSLWKQGDFPFYFVQIAPFRYGNEDPKILARFWEAQAAVTSIPNTAMVITNDIATLNDIHPPNKQDVGLRLANLALKNLYGKSDVVANSPVMESMSVNNNQLSVKFSNTAGGLATRDGKTPSHFELAGVGSKGFQAAKATIDGDQVIIESDLVKQPTAFRFAWNKLAQPNLMGGSGLPVGAVRGGKVPSFFESYPIEKEFKLVYDLDLATLGSQINYETDLHEQAGNFSRIGYLLELESDHAGSQIVFVSMKAFTDDATKIGVPTFESKANFHHKVSDIEIYSNINKISTGKFSSASIEFWPNDYEPTRGLALPGGANNAFDFDDRPGKKVNGYGSMQVHNFGKRETVFAINHWRAEANADIGIGNRSQGNKDWTFSGSAKTYTKKRLRVFVKE